MIDGIAWGLIGLFIFGLIGAAIDSLWWLSLCLPLTLVILLARAAAKKFEELEIWR